MEVVFFCIYQNDHMIFSFILSMWQIILIYLQTVSNLEFLEMQLAYDVINLLSILVIARFGLLCSSMFINKIDL